MRPDFRTPSADPAILREVHAGFVGQAMFCRTCNAVLDCARAVDVTAYGTLVSPEKVVANIIRCGDCFDALAPNLPVRDGLVYEITDGRTLEYPHAR